MTSGSIQNSFDLGSMSFPRKLAVRFKNEYISRYALKGQQVIWQGYEDIDFTKSLGKDFYHEDMINETGWARCAFKGIVPNNVSYWKLKIVNPSTGMLIKTFHFKFTKSFVTSLDGRTYMKDPVLDTLIIKDGVLEELVKTKDGKFKKGHIRYKTKKIGLEAECEYRPEVKEGYENAVWSSRCNYTERPKLVDLITPPHLTKYAKLLLILIKQLVDTNFDASYMTKSSQKPLLLTRFMFDELGNLQSEGHGIDSFSTMLSIGLGQGQLFTLILQTLQLCGLIASNAVRIW